MEDKIKITCTITEEELLVIITNNEPSEVAKAFFDYIIHDNGRWYDEHERANRAEKELASLKEVLVAYTLKIMKE